MTSVDFSSFIPVNEISQTFMCSLVSLPLISAHKTASTKPLGSPTKLYDIQDDANCLFRSLSYVITGRQVYHSVLRHKIIDHMSNIEQYLTPHINGSLDNYLQRTRMLNQNT